MKILRVDMGELSHRWEELPEQYQRFGGRALSSAIVGDEVEPTCDPLGAENKLVVAPGLLAGTLAPSAGRLSVGAKSPLTGTIKEANAGGVTGTKLGRLGVRAIIIEGAPPKGTEEWYSIVVRKDKCEIVQTNAFAGIGLYELLQQIWRDFPSKPGIIGCGIAGQRQLSGAGVFGNNLGNSDPGRFAARGGLGAVLGSKRVVTIISDDRGGSRPVPQDQERFDRGRAMLVDALNKHPITGKLTDEQGRPFGGLKNYGTSFMLNLINEAGALPTRAFRKGQFEHADKISGEAIHDYIRRVRKKFGDTCEGIFAQPCHPECVMTCSNTFPYEETGKAQVSPLEYESVWALGANLEIDELPDIAELNRLCNDLGLDTIETGNALAMAMEADVIKFGDAKGAITLLHEVYDSEKKMGNLIASGAFKTGDALGNKRIPVVKGQALPAYDPRYIRGLGITYCTSPMGADHTAGSTQTAEIIGVMGRVQDPLNVEKADLSRFVQASIAYIDATGYCLFIAFAIGDDTNGFLGMQDTVNGFLGEEVDMFAYGLDILRKEREFNRQAGFAKQDDRLPDFFYKEPVPPHNVTFDVPDEEIDKVFKDF